MVNIDDNRKPIASAFKSGCVFCESIRQGGVTYLFPKIFPDLGLKDQVLVETSYWFLVPDDAPLTDHHLLAISKEHGVSCASLNHEAHEDLLNLVANTRVFFEHIGEYKDLLIFEHGAGFVQDDIVAHCGTCGAHDHAHLHIIPLASTKYSIVDYVKSQIEQKLCLPSNQVRLEALPIGLERPYLFVADNQGGYIYFPTDIQACLTIPSQFFRMLVGERLAIEGDNWDYHHIYKEHLDEARDRITNTIKLFSKNQRAEYR